MPMMDYICPECSAHFEKFFHPTGPAPDTIPCEEGLEEDKCTGIAKLTFEPSIAMQRPFTCDAQGFTPVVVHKDAQGNVRFPGSANAPVPAGFQKVELTNVSQVRKLEREVNAKELARYEGSRQSQKAQSDGEHRARREKFKEMVRNFSPKGKRFAEDMMRVRDERQGRLDKRMTDMGFRVEAFSQNSSNRERYCDAATGWRNGRK